MHVRLIDSAKVMFDTFKRHRRKISPPIFFTRWCDAEQQQPASAADFEHPARSQRQNLFHGVIDPVVNLFDFYRQPGIAANESRCVKSGIVDVRLAVSCIPNCLPLRDKLRALIGR